MESGNMAGDGLKGGVLSYFLKELSLEGASEMARKVFIAVLSIHLLNSLK